MGRIAKMSETVIEAVNVRYVYPDGTVGVDGVSLAIGRGERVAILGPNGSGKSTLLMLIDGLLKPCDGYVRVLGRGLGEGGARGLRGRVGLAFQEADDGLFCPTIREDMAFGPRQMGLPEDEVERRVLSAAEALGVRGLLDRPPFRVSGGERKRAALASVLTMEPEVLLVDEPTASVDPESRRAIVDLLNRLNRERGVTVVVATQDVDLVPAVADRVYLLGREKRIAFEGPVREVFSRPDLMERAGLAPPVIAELFLALREAGILAGARVPVTVDEAVDEIRRLIRPPADPRRRTENISHGGYRL